MMRVKEKLLHPRLLNIYFKAILHSTLLLSIMIASSPYLKYVIQRLLWAIVLFLGHLCLKRVHFTLGIKSKVSKGYWRDAFVSLSHYINNCVFSLWSQNIHHQLVFSVKIINEVLEFTLYISQSINQFLCEYEKYLTLVILTLFLTSSL